MATASIGELELVPVATTVPSIAVLYRSEHVAMVRRLSLMGAPTDLAEHIAHHAFARVSRHWDGLEDPLTSVRQVAVEDVLGRFRPPGRAPTRTPPRDGAPPEWQEVGEALDPLTPAERAVAVLRTYDGLDVESIARLMPIGRHRAPAEVDHRLAIVFADAVADIRPTSRLTELIGASASLPVDDAVPGLRGPYRVRPRPTRPHRRPSSPHGGSSRYWVGAGVIAIVLVGLLGGHLDQALPTPTTRAQEVRSGLTLNGTVVQRRADFSSCPSADPVEGVGGTPLPRAGDTDPERVADVLATDRRAIITLHRGATDARVIRRDGRVLRNVGPGLGRVRAVDAGDDRQIEVVIASRRDCPGAPQGWKGVPLVFTTIEDASSQAGVALTGGFPDGTLWQVWDRPGLGLCGRVGDTTAPCGTKLGQQAQLAPLRLLADGAGHRVVFGYLPPQATAARLERAGGQLGPPTLLPDGATFFALGSSPADRPVRVRFYNDSGAALVAIPFPD